MELASVDNVLYHNVFKTSLQTYVGQSKPNFDEGLKGLVVLACIDFSCQ